VSVVRIGDVCMGWVDADGGLRAAAVLCVCD
jgi:hypothetical protein